MKIIKFVLTGFLIVLTLAVLLAVTVIFFAKFDNKTATGIYFKDIVLRSPFLVKTINLDEPGDFKYLYAASSTKNICVNTYFQIGYEPDSDLEIWVGEIISQTVNKNIYYSIEVLHATTKISYSDEDLNSLRSKLPAKTCDSTLNIIYLNTYKEKPSSTGVVNHRDTIYIFKDTLRNLTDNESVKKRLEKSTFMHEWAHLLGAEHNQTEGCIMNEKVEVHDIPTFREVVSTNYCSEEIKYFRQLKADTSIFSLLLKDEL